MPIETAVARHLNAQGIVAFDESGVAGNTFLYALPSQPDVAVLINPTGGVGTSDNEEGYDTPTLQVITRGAIHDPTGPHLLALAIYAELAGLHKMTLDEGGTEEVWLVNCLPLQSAPANLGRDDNERYQFSQNYALHVRNQTPHRT